MSKEDFEAALRGHQAAVNATKSEQRQKGYLRFLQRAKERGHTESELIMFMNYVNKSLSNLINSRLPLHYRLRNPTYSNNLPLIWGSGLLS